MHPCPSLHRLTSFGAAIVLIAGLAAPLAAGAQSSIVAALKRPLPLYNNPGDAAPARTVPADKIEWKILEEKQDFYRVSVDGKDYWVDSMHVSTRRNVSGAGCTPPPTVVASKRRAENLAATPGAAGNQCP